MRAKIDPISVLSQAWFWLRHVSGDAAYDDYLSSARRNGALGAASGAAAGFALPLSRAEFYVDSLRRRYSTVSRCC